METRRLKLFVEIVDAGSISRAALLLDMAQAALSQQLAILENELKVKLVIRTPGGVRATPAGETLYREAQIVLRQVQHTIDSVRSFSGRLSGRVSIGLTVSSAALLALPLLQAVWARFPQIRLNISESLSGDLTSRLVNGQLDLATLYRPESRVGIEATPIMREEFRLIARSDQLCEDVVRVADLHGRALVLPSNRQVLRRSYEELFDQHAVRPIVVAEIDSIPILKSAVRAGLGGAILPPSVWADELGANLVRAARIVDADLDRTVWLCRVTQPASEEVAVVHDVIRSLASELLSEGAVNGLLPP